MNKPIRAFYSINFGLEGCYMPDSYNGAREINSRKQLAELIRDELRFYEMPQSLFKEARIRQLWGFIKRHGSSQAHFRLNHKQNALRFIGLTENEFNDEMDPERY